MKQIYSFLAMLSLPRNGEDPVIVWSSDHGTNHVGFKTDLTTASISGTAEKNNINTSYSALKSPCATIKNYCRSFPVSSSGSTTFGKTIPLRFIVNNETNATLNAGQANDAFFACNAGEVINIITISDEQGIIVYQKGSCAIQMQMEKFRSGIYVVVAQKTCNSI